VGGDEGVGAPRPESLMGPCARVWAMQKAEEHKLIRKAAAGDRDAASALIRAHQGSLYAYLLRMTGRSDIAEDVTQEAFVRVLTNLDRFDPRFRFSTWLFTIARRLYLNLREKKKPSSESDMLGECAKAAPQPNSVEADDYRASYRDTLQRALMTLSVEQREVVVLFHQHDWPIWLIAEQLSMPEGTVKSHLHRGRIKLREAVLEIASESERTPTFVNEEAWV